jgi:hypothetical protein
MSQFLKVSGVLDITPSGLDGHKYEVSLELGEMNDSAFSPTQKHKVTITTSGTLEAIWSRPPDQLIITTLSSAASLILQAARDQALDRLDSINLNTYTAQKTPPAEPLLLPGALIPIGASRPTTAGTGTLSFLADDIAEIRDQINALSRDLYGDRLLLLPQERAILDVYRPTQSTEEFRNRVQSLAGICTALNKDLIGKELGLSSTTDQGSLLLLDKLVTKIGGDGETKAVTEALKNINELRKGYPAHGDNTDKFLSAHDFFSIRYPVTDFPRSWERILRSYFEAMQRLRKLLSTERDRRVRIKNGSI